MVYAGAQSLHICQINLNKKGSHEYCAREVRPAPCSVSSTPIGGYPSFKEGVAERLLVGLGSDADNVRVARRFVITCKGVKLCTASGSTLQGLTGAAGYC